MTTRTGPRARIAGTVLRALLAVVFATAGAMEVTGMEFAAAGFRRFGYEPWLMTAVGLAQLLGAILLLFRGAAAVGAGLLAIVMVGAVASHLKAGDGIAAALPALILLALLAFVAYAQRRRLRAAALTVSDR